MTEIRQTMQDTDQPQPAEPQGAAEQDTTDDAGAQAPAAGGDAAPAAADGPSLDPLEEEGEVAADYLEELLDTADLDGDIDIEVRDGRTYLSVVAEGEDGESLAALVGEDGEVLEALQELVRLSVLAATDRRSRLVLDIGGYRARRAAALQEMALAAVREAQENGARVHLEPLSAYERKIVHDVVAEHGLFSESEGEGAERHIVVSVSEG
ncbi:single-stranded DNA-binding protein [Kocuria dechangensis]|uniref:Single-stranded DNA-binding protein n=1 Tax=Kocuria dechangensis TaxID=1176249 RepID=A0A917GHR0_9MICC|nr:R3H domain-containing nucleic acid-binding protein [Kocuria dechangensis]GGG46128.1 single-stranded DNA-binding protein [Kocuria dechangensis]